MNILFVGSGDITANYLADRLYREGHQISWVTKDEKSFLLNKDFKGKIYREGYQVNTLKSILRLQGIDTVICRCARDSYVDPIFGEDAAVAAADLMTLGKCGTYRILSGHPMTMEELHSILSVIIQKEIRVKFLNEEDTLPREAYRESSRKLKEETGWMPFCLLREKGGGILGSAVEEYRKRQEKENRTEKKRTFKGLALLKKYAGVKGVLEALLLFGIMLLILPYTRDATDLRYVDIRLAYIAMVSAMFGMKIGIFATFLACVSYVVDLGKDGIDLTYLIYVWKPGCPSSYTGLPARSWAICPTGSRTGSKRWKNGTETFLSATTS